MIFLKEFFQKVKFEKNQQTKKIMKKFPACKELNPLDVLEEPQNDMICINLHMEDAKRALTCVEVSGGIIVW